MKNLNVIPKSEQSKINGGQFGSINNTGDLSNISVRPPFHAPYEPYEPYPIGDFPDHERVLVC